MTGKRENTLVERRPKKPRRFRCEQCQSSFSHRQGLWRHVRETHGLVMLLYCKRCPYKAARRATYNHHYSSCHQSFMWEGRLIQAEVERKQSGPSVARLVAAGWRKAAETVSVAPPSPTENPTPEDQPMATPNEFSLEQEESSDEVVISLSPTPISPLQCPVSPEPLSAPLPVLLPPRGKPRGMLALAPSTSPPGSPSSDTSMPALERVLPRRKATKETASQTPPGRMRVKALVKDQRTRLFFHTGREVKHEEFCVTYEEWVDITN